MNVKEKTNKNMKCWCYKKRVFYFISKFSTSLKKFLMGGHLSVRDFFGVFFIKKNTLLLL